MRHNKVILHSAIHGKTEPHMTSQCSVLNWITLRFFGGWNPKKSVRWLWEASSMMRCGMWLTQDRSASHKTLGRKSRRKMDDKHPHSWDYLSRYQATMKGTDEKNSGKHFQQEDIRANIYISGRQIWAGLKHDSKVHFTI